jgi:hypothetical protein
MYLSCQLNASELFFAPGDVCSVLGTACAAQEQSFNGASCSPTGSERTAPGIVCGDPTRLTTPEDPYCTITIPNIFDNASSFSNGEIRFVCGEQEEIRCLTLPGCLEAFCFTTCSENAQGGCSQFELRQNVNPFLFPNPSNLTRSVLNISGLFADSEVGCVILK